MADRAPLFFGTCSWTDKSLIDSGLFYPPEVRTPEDRLRYYASHFSVVEVDSSYYALPSERNSALWMERTPDHFRFHVKAFRLFTHHPTPQAALPRDIVAFLPQDVRGKANLYVRDLPSGLVTELWQRFGQALLPLESAGKLGLVLFQFPPWFYPSHEARAYMEACQERLTQYRLAVEFRSASWLSEKNRERTVAFLREHRFAFVCVDEPQGFSSSVPSEAIATADVAYVRFHGRNVATWELKGKAASERFNYYYSDEELAQWVPRVRLLQEEAMEVHVLFNTNFREQGPVNAQKMMALLGEGMAGA